MGAAESTGDEDVYAVPDVVVRATRPVTTVGGASQVEAHVDSLPVPADATVEEVLRELPFIHVRTNSRGEAEISARGSESRQVAVLVDGIPVTLAWDARADVSVIPAAALEDVTFTRGLSSMLYGPNVLGGVVEARVGQAHPPSGRTLTVALSADDVGTFRTALTAALPFESETGLFSVRGGVGFRDTPGDPLARKVDEPIDTGDDLRLNTDARNVDGFLALRYRARSGAWVSFSGSSFVEERGIAAELGVPDDDARLWRYPHVSRTLAVISAGTGFHTSPFGGIGDVEASVGYDRGRTEIDGFASRAYEETVDFEDSKDRTLTVRVVGDQSLGERGDLRAGFTLANIHHDESIPDGDFVYRQRLLSVGLENTWRLIRAGDTIEALSLNVGGAYDRAETPEAGGRETQQPISEIGARVGLSAVVRGGRTVLHAGVSRRGRFPALRELYSGALDRFAPNPDLAPEKLVTSEAGATTRLGTGELQVVGFHNVLEDAVVRITLEDGRFMRVNRNQLVSSGIEVVASQRIGPVDVSASGTLMWAEITDTSSDESSRPEHLPDALGRIALAFPIVSGLRGNLDISYTGDQFAIDAVTGEDAELAAEAIVNASLSRTWPLRASWGGGTFTTLVTRVVVENAADVALFDAYGLPEPGRRLRLEIRLR